MVILAQVHGLTMRAGLKVHRPRLARIFLPTLINYFSIHNSYPSSCSSYHSSSSLPYESIVSLVILLNIYISFNLHQQLFIYLHTHLLMLSNPPSQPSLPDTSQPAEPNFSHVHHSAPSQQFALSHHMITRSEASIFNQSSTQ